MDSTRCHVITFADTCAQAEKRTGAQLIMADSSGRRVSHLLADIRWLRDDRSWADVTLLAGGERCPISAHWTILLARCEALRLSDRESKARMKKLPKDVASMRRTLLSRVPGVVETGGGSSASSVAGDVTVCLPNFSEQAVRCFVHFLYTGQVDDDGTVLDDGAVGSGEQCDTNAAAAAGGGGGAADSGRGGGGISTWCWVQLYALAECFHVQSLSTVCEARLFDLRSPPALCPAPSLCSVLAMTVRLEMQMRQTPVVSGVTNGNDVAAGGFRFSLVDRCVCRMSDQADVCFLSGEFRQLPVESVKRLLSSDQLRVESSVLKRALVDWSRCDTQQQQQQQQGEQAISGRAAQSSSDRLSSVIAQLRTVLKDSSLTVSQLLTAVSATNTPAASPADQKPSSAAAATAVAASSYALFSDSQLLNDEQQQLLISWASNSCSSSSSSPRPPAAGANSWKLVFRASQHSWSAAAFHRVCDGLAPLYIVCKGDQGQLCGGFTDVPWLPPSCPNTQLTSLVTTSSSSTSCGAGGAGAPASWGYSCSSRAFMFSLVSLAGAPPVKLPVLKPVYAICYHAQCGPVFGAGADLCVSDLCHSCTLSYSNTPHSYAPPDSTTSSSTQHHLLFGFYSFAIADYEVFTPVVATRH